MEATVITMRCTRRAQPYGVRVQKDGEDWVRTWAFKMTEQQMSHEGYDKTEVVGSLNAVGNYSGCPYCGTFVFVQCNNCGKMSCYNGEKEMDCQWCGYHMENFCTAESFDVEGGGV